MPDRVIVYTRSGDLKSLPQHATPLDFAYYIHEEVGHMCVGSRVNGHWVSLDYELQLGDRVEIITRKGAKPSLDWIYNGYARTRRARDKIKRFFREKPEEATVVPEVEEIGRTIIRKRLSASRIRDLALEKLAEILRLPTPHELVEAVGIGEITITQLDDALSAYVLAQLTPDRLPASPAAFQPTSRQEFDLLYTQAQCCLPVPGDPTISYITQGRGFMLHRPGLPQRTHT
ncbi:MAG: bifunctional (p)ppGpp synthetase/guanosine-3',5'-bis(diphosphate) 3'-pyrophosphohydrolase [Anaerolineae bacterium]|nr:bifunctional (p)ppGpp synthetase/guanosine-3',5'-bis(diphosphate) 3'-pyrophosphohydrolase [Anaerolineae bacterium]